MIDEKIVAKDSKELDVKSVQSKAISLGFDAFSITPSKILDTSNFKHWIKQGFHANMHYLSDAIKIEKRTDVKIILPEVKSVWVGLMSYQNHESHSDPNNKIARYAWGKDYHSVMSDAFLKLAKHTESIINTNFQYKIYCDTGPLLERQWAFLSGLGWIGKNTMLINQSLGSYTLIGLMLTNLEVHQKNNTHPFRCGTCTRCLDACPTQAFEASFVLNANKCISYHTIESKEPTLPNFIKQNQNNWIYGCDICQEVCPWNLKAKITGHDEFKKTTHSLMMPSSLLQMDEQSFKKTIQPSAMNRIKQHQLKRNMTNNET